MTARLRALAVGCLLAACVPPAHAASRQSITLLAGIGVSYDDNLLEYSQSQLDDFASGLHPDRYSLKTRGDAVYEPTLGLGWELDAGGGRRHIVRLRTGADLHAKDATADSRSYSGSWSETFAGDRRLTAGVYELPHYYLRQLLAEDVVPPLPGLSRERRAEFGLRIASIDWSQRVGGSMPIGLGYQFEQRDYVRDFDERDSHVNEGSASIGWDRRPRRAALRLDGAWRVCRAKGEDGDEVPGLVADDVDVSYHGFSAGGSGRIELLRKRRWRCTGDLAYTLERRIYDSNRAADRFHLDRKDLRHDVEMGVRTAYRPHWAVRAFYHLERQSADTPHATGSTSDAGSYMRNRVGVAIEWSATHRFASATPEPADAE